MKVPTYYMVHCQDQGVPRKMHADYEAAATEAARLAAKNQGPVFILKAVGGVKPVEPAVIGFECE